MNEARPMTDEETRELKLREIPKDHRDAIHAYEEALAEYRIADRRLTALHRDLTTAEKEAQDAAARVDETWEVLVTFRARNPS